ncbi:TRAP transporter small permease subunit [Sulfitobacter sp. HNIBRBA3233]|uniref:TRAP transporter small permease subunit n=1 Tax=Sulfitobacter marinivivus TaxID=3158558 RepID=UPI0032DF2027
MAEPDHTPGSRLLDALTTIAGIAVLLLLLSQILVVALRYVFALGWPWATDLLTYLNFVIVSLPLIGVVVYNTGVRVDVLRAFMSRRLQTLFDRIALLGLFLPAMLWAAWTSWPLTMNSWSLYEASPNVGGLPGYFLLKTLLSAIFAGLAIAALWIGLRPRVYEDSHDA